MLVRPVHRPTSSSSAVAAWARRRTVLRARPSWRAMGRSPIPWSIRSWTAACCSRIGSESRPDRRGPAGESGASAAVSRGGAARDWSVSSGSRSRARWWMTVFSTASTLPDVPAVGNMDCVWCPQPARLGVGDGPVTTDNLDAGMVSQPRGHRGNGPVGQEVDRAATVDVHQDGAVDVPLAQCELVHPEHLWRTRRRLGQGTYQPQQCRPARRDGERVHQPGTGPARQHQSQPLQDRLQTDASPSVAEGQAMDLLDKRRPRTRSLATAKPADP